MECSVNISRLNFTLYGFEITLWVPQKLAKSLSCEYAIEQRARYPKNELSTPG